MRYRRLQRLHCRGWHKPRGRHVSQKEVPRLDHPPYLDVTALRQRAVVTAVNLEARPPRQIRPPVRWRAVNAQTGTGFRCSSTPARPRAPSRPI